MMDVIMNYELGIMNGGIGRFPVKGGRSSSIPHSSFLIPRSLRAFTLVELLLVVAIMGIMGTLSVGGYRAMRRGMEERGTMQNVNQFVRNAYQRAMIDRQPTAVYFWNETRQDEKSGDSALIVVGRAVAVRRAGRVSYIDNGKKCLVDEFGDLKFYKAMDEEGEREDDNEAQDGIKSFIYKVNGNESGFKRYAASQATMKAQSQNIAQMMTDPDWRDNVQERAVLAYGYYLPGGVGDWRVGDAYGFEFAEMTLPNNYIFETTYSTDAKDPVKTVSKVLRFSPTDGAGGQTISVSAIRPGKTGAPEAQKVGTTESADSQLSKQNK